MSPGAKVAPDEPPRLSRTQTWRRQHLNGQTFTSPTVSLSLTSVPEAQNPPPSLSDLPPSVPAPAPGNDRPERRGR